MNSHFWYIGTVMQGTTNIIKSSVPLSEMFGYATDLRSRTQGRGSFTMHFARYEEVPKSIGEEIIADPVPPATFSCVPPATC